MSDSVIQMGTWLCGKELNWIMPTISDIQLIPI